jgi:putative spermidine/putrescine transport system permease protein
VRATRDDADSPVQRSDCRRPQASGRGPEGAHERGFRAVILKILLVSSVLLVLVPMLLVGVWSCVDAWPWPQLLPAGFSTRAFTGVFVQPGFAATLLRSVGIAIGTAFLSVTVALLVVRALVLYEFVGRELVRFATMLPFLIPVTVFAMGIQVAFLRMGLGNTVLGVIIAHSIVALPYAVTLLYEVQSALGSTYEEQAAVLGAGPMRSLLQVTLPGLLPGVVAAAAMSYILSMSQYFLTLLIGGGSVPTLATVMFPFLTSGDRSVAAAYGIVFMVLTLLVFLVFELLMNRLGIKESDSLFT